MDRGLYIASVFLIFMGIIGVWLGLYANISETFREITGISLVILLLGLGVLPIALYRGGKPPVESIIPLILLFVLGFYTIGWQFMFPSEQISGTGIIEKIHLLAGEYWFNETNPNISVTKGSTVIVTITNVGKIVHTFKVLQVSEDSGNIFPNQTVQVEFIAGQAGTYQYICTIPGHAELGMKGWFIIREGNATATETE